MTIKKISVKTDENGVVSTTQKCLVCGITKTTLSNKEEPLRTFCLMCRNNKRKAERVKQQIENDFN